MQTGDLGACLRTTPWISALAEGGVERIDVIARPALAELFERHPRVGRALRVAPGPGAWWRALCAVRRERYPLLLDLTGSVSSSLLATLGGAAARLGVGRGRDPDELFEALGVEAVQRQPPLELDPAAEAVACAMLADLGFDREARLIVLTPRPDERVPASVWRELAVAISERWRAVPVALFAPGETRDVPLVADLLGHCFVLHAPDLATFAEILRRGGVLICADEGSGLLAAAMGTPSVSLTDAGTLERALMLAGELLGASPSRPPRAGSTGP